MKAVPVANIARYPMLITPQPAKRNNVVEYRGKNSSWICTIVRESVTLRPYAIVPTHFVRIVEDEPQ